MNISPLSIQNSLNLNNKINFKGQLCFDRQLQNICDWSDKYKSEWARKFPEDTAIVFNYLKRNKEKGTITYNYRLYTNVHKKPVKEGDLDFSDSPYSQYDNKQALIDFLSNTLFYIKNIFPNDDD